MISTEPTPTVRIDYLFSRSGPPAALDVWIVPRSWLVGICSGATLVIGFLAIFSKLRFRTIWVGIAAVGLLAAVLVQPSVTFLAIQSAVIGGGLTLVGLVIERVVERSKSLPNFSLRWAVNATRRGADSSLTRPVGVGSDDPTAIRVRVPSTLDHVPAPAAISARARDGGLNRGAHVKRAGQRHNGRDVREERKSRFLSMVEFLNGPFPILNDESVDPEGCEHPLGGSPLGKARAGGASDPGLDRRRTTPRSSVSTFRPETFHDGFRRAPNYG